MQLKKMQVQKREYKNEMDTLTLRSDTCRDLVNTCMATLENEVEHLKTIVSEKKKEIREACELDKFLLMVSDLR